MTEAERIDFLIQVLESGNGAAFAKKIGTSPMQVSRMRNGRCSLRLHITGIITAYPNISRQWLATGEGYPGDISIDLAKASYEEKLERANKTIDHLMRRIDELEKQLQQHNKQ